MTTFTISLKPEDLARFDKISEATSGNETSNLKQIAVVNQAIDQYRGDSSNQTSEAIVYLGTINSNDRREVAIDEGRFHKLKGLADELHLKHHEMATLIMVDFLNSQPAGEVDHVANEETEGAP